MRCKDRIWFWAACCALHCFRAERASASAQPPVGAFCGSQSCSSSSCHGGAAPGHDEYTTWVLRDFHYERPAATLTTARSERLAETLHLADPSKSGRCTPCHVPLLSIAQRQNQPALPIEAGVACESCHGPAENWIRSHTRPDYTHRDRVRAGMRDLQNLYTRANTCVACHQNLGSDLLAAGHPELTFELDGQGTAQPKHWREAAGWHGAQAWLVGQAVALREMSWFLAREAGAKENETNGWRSLAWLLRVAGGSDPGWPQAPPNSADPASMAVVQSWSDTFARAVSTTRWTEAQSRKLLRDLAQTIPDFSDRSPRPLQARRAARLLLGLQRLMVDMGRGEDAPVQAALARLVRRLEAPSDFQADAFGNDLAAFFRLVGALETGQTAPSGTLLNRDSAPR